MQYDALDEAAPSGGESDSGSDGSKKRGRGSAVSRKRGRVSGRGSAAGPPVDGAVARVDVWLPDCDIHGNPVSKVCHIPLLPVSCGPLRDLAMHHSIFRTSFEVIRTLGITFVLEARRFTGFTGGAG
jgi:hypothetical protein